MRRGLRPQRVPMTHQDEFTAHIQRIGESIKHQIREKEMQCDECWDELKGDYSPACSQCSGSGYYVGSEIRRKTAYVSYNQPAGNMGEAGRVYKAGGQQTRYAAYIYTDFKSGKRIKEGHRLIVNQSGLREEFVVMNNRPLRSAKNTIGWVAECESASDKSLEEVNV